ncbi:Virus X resistance protein-like, coiled-coil domain [Sesbania bispinosa]|nr:Virus X resistance protein-like, coiled-coil domain [Sesbania bispinosa]
MAEIAVNLVINKLMLLLKGGVYPVRDVRSQLMLVKDQLRLIQAYLRDADAKAEMAKTSNLMKDWVAQIREVSYCIEDVFDEYLLQVENKHCDKCGVVGVVCKVCDLLRSIMHRHKILSQTGEIESLERLNKAQETFEFNPSALESSSDGVLPGNSYSLQES